MRISRGHVYLLDDNADVRFYLSGLLRELGYSVETHHDADHFFTHAVQIAPAVVVLDMRMPGLTGLQAQRRLHEMGWQIPVVFISGESQAQEIIDAMKAGAIDFLCKPFSKDQLVRAIEQALNRSREWQAQAERLRVIQKGWALMSERERELFFLIVKGHSNQTLGEMTGVQAGTIKKHRAAVFQKMAVESTAELIELCQGLDLSRLS